MTKQEGEDNETLGKSLEINKTLSDIDFSDPEAYSKFLHDLRSPLTSILGMVEIIKLIMNENKTEIQEMQWYVQQIEQEALRMRNMLR